MKSRFGFILAAAFLACFSAGAAERTRPGEGGEPLPVYMSVFVIDIDGIDTAEQSFTANVAYRARWKDKRLAHRSKESKLYPLTEVWHPEIQIINQQRLWKTFPEVIEVDSEGNAVYTQRVWGQFSQPLRLHDFPFDRHSFNVLVALAGYTPEEVTILQDDQSRSDIAEELSLADFTVESSLARPKVYEPIPGGKKISGFNFEFVALRDSGYYVVKVLVPLVLIVAMSWIVFWIDPKEAGTQIGLGATAMLTLIAYRFATSESLPKVAYATKMDYFILGSTLLVFASLLEVVVTAHLARTEKLKTARWIDRVMRLVFPTAFLLLAIESFVV